MSREDLALELELPQGFGLNKFIIFVLKFN